jgi:hypothetical protein
MAVELDSIIVPQLLKEFKDLDDQFLTPIKSHDDKVKFDVINFTEIGAEPNVLIDNVTYPIAIVGRTDENRPVSLHKLDTENTPITDDELHALAYDKISSVRTQHAEALKRKYLKLGAHSLAPTSHTTNTPVIQTSGATDGLRKKITAADLIRYKRLIDALEIPIESRYLVLCSDHVNDILEFDQSFRDRYSNTESGKLISRISGFQIYESLHTPKFVGTTYAKKAFNAAAAATDINASVFYSNINNMKAIGSTSVYMSVAKDDPIYRRTILGCRQYGIVSPVNAKGQGAITDFYVAP